MEYVHLNILTEFFFHFRVAIIWPIRNRFGWFLIINASSLQELPVDVSCDRIRPPVQKMIFRPNSWMTIFRPKIWPNFELWNVHWKWILAIFQLLFNIFCWVYTRNHCLSGHPGINDLYTLGIYEQNGINLIHLEIGVSREWDCSRSAKNGFRIGYRFDPWIFHQSQTMSRNLLYYLLAI